MQDALCRHWIVSNTVNIRVVSRLRGNITETCFSVIGLLRNLAVYVLTHKILNLISSYLLILLLFQMDVGNTILLFRYRFTY